MDKPLGILGVPSELGANRPGTAQSPKVVIPHVLNHLNHAIDLGMIKVPKKKQKTNPNAKQINQIVKLCDCMQGVFSDHVFPVVIGGDHSITHCAVRSLVVNKKLGLIYCDAHGDFNTQQSTPSGNVHGMVVKEITARANRKEHGHKTPHIKEENIVLIGTRELDKGEIILLKKSKVSVFTAKQVKKLGIKKVMQQAIKIAQKGTQGFHLSIDVDVIDNKYVKGASTPSPGGITPNQIKSLVTMATRAKLNSLDIMEYSPRYDKNKQTLNIITDILKIVDKAN